MAMSRSSSLDTIIDLIQEKLGSVDQHIINIAENTFCFLDLLSLSAIEIKLLLATMGVEP